MATLLKQTLNILKADIEEQTTNFQNGFLHKAVSSLEETVDHPTDSQFVERQ